MSVSWSDKKYVAEFLFDAKEYATKLPNSREKSLVLRKIDEAEMWLERVDDGSA